MNFKDFFIEACLSQTCLPKDYIDNLLEELMFMVDYTANEKRLDKLIGSIDTKTAYKFYIKGFGYYSLNTMDVADKPKFLHEFNKLLSGNDSVYTIVCSWILGQFEITYKLKFDTGAFTPDIRLIIDIWDLQNNELIFSDDGRTSMVYDEFIDWIKEK